MRRRDFITLLGGAAAAWPLAARAQQGVSVPRIGYLFSFNRAEGKHLWDASRQGLRDLGYMEGQNIIVEPRWAEGQYERLPKLLAELEHLKVEVIVIAATPGNVAAKARASTLPIVFVSVAGPGNDG